MIAEQLDCGADFLRSSEAATERVIKQMKAINADLLAALKQVQDDVGDRLTGKTTLMIRAAIAKAEGTAK